jgi:uncharacterized membrane protein YeaQ/YmgE (transglycosylase-associated protein family)
MDQTLVFFLTFFLHFSTSLTLAVRIVGVRTKKMAASYALFNIIFFVSRMANTLQAPLVAGKVEKGILNALPPDHFLFYGVIFSAFLGSLLGAFFIPTLQRFMVSAVEKVYLKNSLLSVVFKSINLKTARLLIKSFSIPKKQTIMSLLNWNGISKKIVFYNVIISALLTVSVLSCLYAGYLNPDLRSTSLSLNGFIVGLSSLLFMLIVEPHIGIIADKVINLELEEGFFRRYLSLIVSARILGTILSIFLLKPFAWLVIFIAQIFS